jgi:RHS repeat-associated protein
MSGDNFSIRVSSWYKTNGASPATPAPNPLPDLIAALATGIGGLPNAHGTMADLQDGTLLTPGITNFFTSRDDSTNASRPKAYLNWVLFDEQFRFVSASSGAEQVPEESAYNNGSSTPNVYTHVKTNLPVTNNGYLYIYVSNETPNIDVFFDNLQVTHTRGPLLEETHYYPWGLTMMGISSKATKSGYAENRKGFNGNEIQNKEFSDESGLETYDFNARFYDPQTGRFGQIDPMADEVEHLSAYVFASNDPTLRNDPSGLKDTVVNGEHGITSAPLKEAVKTAKSSGFPDYQPAFAPVALPWGGFGGSGSSILTKTGWGVIALATIYTQVKFGELTRKFAEQRYWITYYKIGPKGQIYVGRCSGMGNSAQEVLEKYDASHRMSTYGPAQLDKSVSGSDFAKYQLPGSTIEFGLTEIGGYSATRGREQQLYDFYKLQGVAMGNSINPVSPLNPLAPTYWAASTALFGPLTQFGATY